MATIIRRSLLRKIGRNFSTGANFCYIMGENGPMAYNIDQFEEWDEYLKRKPMLSFMPRSGMCGNLYDQKRPYQTNDSTRKTVRTGALAVRNASHCGLSLVNPFTKGNVGVLKRLGCIAFRNLQLDPREEWGSDPSAGYHHYSDFLKDSIWNTYGLSSTSELPQQFEAYLEDLEKPHIEEDFIVDHPSTLPNMEYTDVCMEAYWSLIKEKCASPSDIEDILTAIGKTHPMALLDVLKYEILHQFLPKYLQSQFPARKYPFTGMTVTALTEAQLGEVVVEVHRHTATHCQDQYVQNLVSSRLNIKNYSRKDFIELLRMVYPNYLKDAYPKLDAKNLLLNLKVRERQPIPSLYMAPASALVSFRCITIFMKD